MHRGDILATNNKQLKCLFCFMHSKTKFIFTIINMHLKTFLLHMYLRMLKIVLKYYFILKL